MTRNDIRVKFNKEKDLHVLQTEGTGYIHYTDDYVHWLEDIVLKQANGAGQGDSNCNIPLVSNNEVAVCEYAKNTQGDKVAKSCNECTLCND